MRASSPSRTAVRALRQLVDGADEGRGADRACLGRQPLGVGGGHHEGVGHLADRLGDEQVAQVGEQVAGELGRVAAGAGHLLDPEQDALGVLGDDRVDRVEEQLGVGGAEQLEHRVRARPGCRRRRPAGRACRARRGSCPRPSGRSSPPRRPRPRSPRRRRPAVSTSEICSSEGRWKSKRWQRSAIVAITLCDSVVARTKTVFGGGSSSVLRKAFQASLVSMCASSRM